MGSEGSPRGVTKRGSVKGCQEERNFSCSRGVRVRRVGAQKGRQCDMGAQKELQEFCSCRSVKGRKEERGVRGGWWY